MSQYPESGININSPLRACGGYPVQNYDSLYTWGDPRMWGLSFPEHQLLRDFFAKKLKNFAQMPQNAKP